MGKTSLVIMAAGMGSRYGGIKQIESVGPCGEIILDYSVYDALEAGFSKIVIIIRKDIEKEFRAVVGKRMEQLAEVEYVFQELDDLPKGFTKPDGRTKPWGTGQAILCCKDVLKEPFAVINADDYYGKKAYQKIYDFLNAPKKESGKYEFCMAGFRLGNTLSDNGTVTRGVCTVENGILKRVDETKGIAKGEGAAVTSIKTIPLDQPVSMNMWGFTREFITELEQGFPKFLSEVIGSEIEQSGEYLLPIIVDQLIREDKVNVHVLDTDDKWFGVTYKEDKEIVAQSFADLVEKGVYHSGLFD